MLGVLQPNPFKDTTNYWVEFDSVQGLGAIGRDVRVAGVNVGTIGDVKREGDNAVVEIELEQDIPLHVDARADMRPHTLFEGSSFIDLAPGSPSAKALEPGATIPIEQTSNYVTLDEALRVLRPEIRDNLARPRRGRREDAPRRGDRRDPDEPEATRPQLMRDLRGPVRALQGAHREELQRRDRGMSRTVDAVAEREAGSDPARPAGQPHRRPLTVDARPPARPDPCGAARARCASSATARRS